MPVAHIVSNLAKTVTALSTPPTPARQSTGQGCDTRERHHHVVPATDTTHQHRTSCSQCRSTNRLQRRTCQALRGTVKAEKGSRGKVNTIAPDGRHTICVVDVGCGSHIVGRIYHAEIVEAEDDCAMHQRLCAALVSPPCSFPWLTGVGSGLVAHRKDPRNIRRCSTRCARRILRHH